jgi:hypothetical protein
MRGNRISKDNTPRDQMASILKEEAAAQAADTPAVKVAGSVGRYSNMEYWQHKSETFKQQVRAQVCTICCVALTRLLVAQQRGSDFRSTIAQGVNACVPQPDNMGVNRAIFSRVACAYLKLAHVSGLRPCTDKTNEGGCCKLSDDRQMCARKSTSPRHSQASSRLCREAAAQHWFDENRHVTPASLAAVHRSAVKELHKRWIDGRCEC